MCKLVALDNADFRRPIPLCIRPKFEHLLGKCGKVLENEFLAQRLESSMKLECYWLTIETDSTTV